MAQIQKLIQENQKLKYQLEKFKSSNGLLPYIDDSAIKGSYHVVKNIAERDSIDCCHRKLGMKVLVIGNDLSFKEYILKTDDCKKNIWEEVDVTVEENEVFLIEDYSELSENLTTQKELNLILKQLILNLQTQIDNIELIDEKVQITETTNFAQIGQTQKDFNRSVSNYKTNSDLKNQEQDDRLTDIEGENVAQYDLINDLNSELDFERVRNDAQDSRLVNLEGINYTWSPTNRTLTLYDNNGNQLSQVSLVSLDNEGTDLRYNASTLSLDLYNADNELLDSIPVSSFIGSVGTQLQLNSNQLQLRDSQGNILSTVSFTVSNIQGLQTALDNKLNKPTTTSNTTSYPYVVGEDGNGNSARLPAGDLGKNFFNADLSNTTARNHTMNAGVTVNTLGNPYSITGLPNKNTDIANFRKVRVQNTSGLDAVVDSKNLLRDGMTSMTDAEKDAWRLAQRKTGETYSIGQPRIDFVFPSYINNSITYVQPLVLYGINLYIDNQTPNSIVQLNRVEDINGNAVNELYNITNFEVSPLKTNQIVLMLDWSLYPKGKYKFKVLNNSLQSLVSDGFVILNNSVPNQLNSITWQVLSNPTQAANNSILTVSNKSFSYERKNIASGIAQPTHIMYSDQELVGNFVVELNVGLGESFVYDGANQNVYNIGLIASSSVASASSFTLSILNGFEFKWEWDYGGVYITDKGYLRDRYNGKLGSGGKIYYIKHQGYITICFITNNGNLVFLSSAIAVNEPLRLFNSFFNQGRFLNKTVNFNYGQIFTY